MQAKNDNDSINSSESSECMWSNEVPFHVDVSAQKAFYRSMTVVPPSHLYAAIEKYNQNTHDDQEWTVTMGDTVAIQVEENRSTKRRKLNGASKEWMYYPYTVPWWCAEVVAIYRALDSVDEAMELRKESTKMRDGETSRMTDNETYGQFHLELRWLYRMEDIPGFTKIAPEKVEKEKDQDDKKLEEIFETDDIGVFPANTLLGPIHLHSDPNTWNPTETLERGMPVEHFLCRRFWTIFRKTLMPVGSSDTRFQRGMMYSSYLGRGSAVRASFEMVMGNKKDTVKEIQISTDWRRAFMDTISKLNLAESSAVVGRGTQVIGRETQQSQIKNFLHSAFLRVNAYDTLDATTTNVFALFLAGPPGTGKTASVNSIIYQLHHEQAEGLVPEFTFVSVNGMELRDPFDIYVHLWEAVSPSKEKLDRVKALARLQLYFSESSSSSSSSESKSKSPSSGRGKMKRKAVVVLVDEIDYLVTRKQTILYNLFDWPWTGYENKSDAQLIVIGISNTLNLPERLHPRLQSRIGKQRCIFKAYSWTDSVEILEGKLGITGNANESIFHSDAMKFASKKIASESGDIRKMFQLCKSAAENVFLELTSGKRKLPPTSQNAAGVIGVGDIQNAAKGMFNSVLYTAVAHATSYQVLLFVALASLHRSTGRESGGFTLEEVVIKMESIADAFGSPRYLPCPQYHMVMGMLCPLGEAGILKLSTRNGAQGKYGTSSSGVFISLKLDAYEVLSCLKGSAHFALAQKYLDQKAFSYNI